MSHLHEIHIQYWSGKIPKGKGIEMFQTTCKWNKEFKLKSRKEVLSARRAILKVLGGV